jgi:cell division protein FtsB
MAGKIPLIEIMKMAKYLFSLWAGVLIYASLFLISGAKGFSAHRQLENEQKKQEANIEYLKLINQELEETVNSLLYDKDTLAVYAREQGYASSQEKFIRIVGLGVNQKNKTFPGKVISAVEPQYTPEKTIIMIAFCAGASIFLCIAVFDILKLFRDPA